MTPAYWYSTDWCEPFLQDDFIQLGGTELAPMSTTTSLQVTGQCL